MSNKAKSPLVPKLRFPEFRGTEGWKAVPLSELISALDAGVSVNSGDRPATENEIGILKTSAVTNGIFEPQENKVVFDEVERGRVKEPVQAGTIIISRMNTPALVGANAYVEISLENIYLPDRLWAAKPKSGTSMRFVAAILGSDKGRAALSKLAKGSSGSMKNITKPDVFAYLIEAPSPAEQQKIAECLSSLDELIATQARKVDALKTHKKGLMQQLFPREGETQPRLRFPEFRDAGEWKPKALGEVVKVASGQVDPTLPPHCDFPQIGSENIESDSGKLVDLKSARDKGVISGNYAFDENDVLYSKIRPALNKAAAPTFEGICSADIYPIRPANDELQRSYLLYLLLSPRFLDYAIGKSERGKIPKINRDDLLSFEALVPLLAEQKRIADCLTSLDTVITTATQELETLKTHKKGLMHQLFPSAEAVEA
ncbi:MAG: restriction endonuclease subunit S [Burkholderiaceae bacterium]|nr:restriction endonuclease subunit S [Burkholderiaceae bacterium]